MKKILSLLFFAFAVSSTLFAAPFSIADLATDKLGDYDKPLIDAIAYFLASFQSFNRIAITLAIAFGFIGVTWSAVKIMFGSENTRKIALDTMIKFLIYTLVMTLYSEITIGILDTSTTIGMFAGGGYSNINSKFMTFRRQLENDTDVAKNEMQRMLNAVSDPTNNKNIALTEDLVRKMVSRFTVNKEEEDRIISELGQAYNIMTNEEYEKYKEEKYDTYTERGLIGVIAGSIQNRRKIISDFTTLSKEVDGRNAKKIAEQGWDSPAVKHAIISLKAINEIMAANPEYNEQAAAASRSYNTPRYLFDPFMRDKNNKQTKLLSPGAMIKIGVVISDIINYRTLHEFDAEGNIVDKTVTTIKNGVAHTFLRSIQEAVFSFIFTVGMMLACVFCAIQYCMTVFEFFIVTSVGIIFVPCILWDGTKSFASKLITLFLAYFFKLMLMIFCLFWVYGFFIDTGIDMLKENNMFSFLNIGRFIFSILLGWVVTQNGPKLATTLLNGTPDLSMGEFVRAAGTAVAGAYAAKKAAAGVANTASNLGKTAHKGIQSAGRTFAGLDAMSRGVSAAVNSEGDKQNWNKGERAKQWASGMAGLIGQNVKNSASTFFTGVGSNKTEKEGVSSLGKAKNSRGGIQDKNDAKEGAKKYMDDKFNKENEKAKTNNSPPQNTTPHFDNKRDTNA